MTNLYNLSIVLPTYNEAENLPVICDRIARTLTFTDYEIIVADDNSPDMTWEIGIKIAKDSGNIRVLRRMLRRGLSAACIDAVQAAMGKFIVVMDADLQHDESLIEQLLQALKDGADVALASRFATGASAHGLLSPFRKFLSLFGIRVASLVLGRELSDPLTGFFAIRRDVFLRLLPRLSDSGFKILFDLLYVDRSLKVAELGFHFAPRLNGYSKLTASIIWQFVAYLGEKFTFGLVPARLVSFLAVGLSGVLFHFLTLLSYRHFISSEVFWHGQLFATLVAFLTNFMLNNALTFRDKQLRGYRYFLGLAVFAATSSVGILGNISVSGYLNSVGSQGLALSALAGILVDSIWKFVVAERVIWKR